MTSNRNRSGGRFISGFKILCILLFIAAASSAAFAGTLTYNFANDKITFKLTFDKGYSNVLDFTDGQQQIVTFESTESISFERQDFFDAPIRSVWLETEGTRKKLIFLFENNKIIVPQITKQNKTIVLDFAVPEVIKAEAPSGLPGVGAYVRMFLGLLIIIAIIIGSIVVMRFFFKNNMVTDIPGVGRLLGKVNVDIKKQLVFYELGDVIYILGVTENGINTVDKITDPIEVTTIKSGFSKRKDFSSYMKIFRKHTELADDFTSASEDIGEKISSIKRK